MDVPVYVTVSVVLVSLFAVVAVAVVPARATPAVSAARVSSLTVGVALGAWFLATALFALSGAYRAASAEAVPMVGVALVVSLVVVYLALAVFPALRTVVGMPAAQSALIGLQVWRIEGLAFLVLLALGQLPALFAVPAGIGDVFVGLTAPIVARSIRHHRLAVAWNIFGLVDLILAVFLGATTNPGRALLFMTTPPSEPMTVFPMAIIPTFLVPLSIALHFVSLRYLLRPSAASLSVAW